MALKILITRRALAGYAGCSVFAAAAMLAGCDGLLPGGASKPAFKGIDITGAEYARQLAMPDASGKPRMLTEFKGKVVVVFFGYTQCPDVCPTTLAEIAEVRTRLGADGAKVQPIDRKSVV